MSAVLPITALTLKEAVRRRALAGLALLGFLILCLSMLLMVIKSHMEYLVSTGRQPADWMVVQYPIAASLVLWLCINVIKGLGAVVGVLLAGGAVSSEIERGLLAAILPHPFPRRNLILGKWIGLCLIGGGASVFWSFLVYLSLNSQTHTVHPAILKASPVLALYPIVTTSVALMFSTVAPRLLGAILTLALGILAWIDGFLNWLGGFYHVQLLHKLSVAASLLLPQSIAGYWLDSVLHNELFVPGPAGRRGVWVSPRPLVHLGTQWHIPHLDALYFFLYVLAALTAGMIMFEKRDIA